MTARINKIKCMTTVIFITGTDTNIGKTFVSCVLLKAFNTLGLKTFGIKPIASGGQRYDDGNFKNQDALYLQQYASIKKPYHVINPILFKKPIAPNIAANEEGFQLSRSFVVNAILSSLQSDADLNLIEGVGGWAVPLNNTELFSDVITELKIPVILVVGIKLGCLNHALLTYQSICAKGVSLIGWIANCVEQSTLLMAENIQTLQRWIKAPCLGIIPHNDTSPEHINIQFIRQYSP